MKSCHREFIRSRNFVYVRKHWVTGCHCCWVGFIRHSGPSAHPPSLAGWAGGEGLLKLTFRLHHVALMSRDECAPLEPLATDCFCVEFLCHLSGREPTFFWKCILPWHSLSLFQLPSADADFIQHLLASLQGICSRHLISWWGIRETIVESWLMTTEKISCVTGFCFVLEVTGLIDTRLAGIL